MEQVFTLKPNYIFEGNVNFNFSREHISFPGTPQLINNINKIERKYVYKYTNLTKSNENYILNFFVDRRAKHKNFWLPVWKNTYELLQSISPSETEIRIKNCLLSSMYNQYEYVYFEMKNGDFFYYQINTVDYISETEELINIFNSITDEININLIKYFGKLLLVRFDFNELEFTFTTNTISEVSLNFVELPNEYYPED